MSHSDEIRDLFARYAAEVGRHLPFRGREDIEREIAATLADRLDDRLRSTGQLATVDDAVALLRETGHPRATAASYLADARLIGPALYPLFLMICRIVLPVLAAVLIGALTLSAALAADPAVGFLEHLLRVLASTVSGLLQAFGLIVIIFAVLEQAQARHEAAGTAAGEEAWDPRKLPRVVPTPAIKIADQIAAIVGNTIVIAAVLLLPRVVFLNPGQLGRTLPLARLSEGFFRLLPVVVAVSAAQILAALFLLTRRTHTVATLATSAAVKILGVAAAGIYLTVWPFVLPQADATAAAELGIRVLNQVIRVGCILGIVFGSLDVARELVRFLRSTRAGGRA